MMDFEEELMDLESNVDVYLPRVSSQNSTRLSKQLVHKLSTISNNASHQIQSSSSSTHLSTSPSTKQLQSLSSLTISNVDTELNERIQNLLLKKQNQINTYLHNQPIQELISTYFYCDPIDSFTARMNGRVDYIIETSISMTKSSSQTHYCYGKLTSGQDERLWKELLEIYYESDDYIQSQVSTNYFLEQMKYINRAHDPNERAYQVIQAYCHRIFDKSTTKSNTSILFKRHEQHPIALFLHIFVYLFQSCYEPLYQEYIGQKTYSNTMKDGNIQATILLPCIGVDLKEVTDILVQLFLMKFTMLEEYTDIFQRCIMEYFFDILQPTLHGLYIVAFHTEDMYLQQYVQSIRHNSVEILEIPMKYQLLHPQDHQISVDHVNGGVLIEYTDVLEKMNSFSSYRSPWRKVELLAEICHELNATIERYYSNLPIHARPKNLTMNADDLCALLAYLFIHSPTTCMHGFTHLALMGTYLPSTFETGEKGFAVASFASSIRHLCDLSTNTNVV